MANWEEIELAESYMVCCLFDDATSLSSSIIKQLQVSDSYDKQDDFFDMIESAGMVFVQSLNQLHRSSEILNELKLLFGSFTSVPLQVFVTGACFQISGSPLTSVESSLEEFLNSWTYADGRYYPLSVSEDSLSDKKEGSCARLSIGVDQYLQVVELYVVTLLATTLKDMGRAVSWVEEKAMLLPMDERQYLLRRLHSMNSSTSTTSSQASTSAQLPNGYRSDFSRDKESYNGNQEAIESKGLPRGGNTAKDEILKLSRQRVPYFWWFPTISLKLGNTRFVVPNGKMLMGLLLLLVYYLTRKKQAVWKRALAEKALSMKKALVDFWQLAFSYQVNPLAAVQTLPTSTRGSY